MCMREKSEYRHFMFSSFSKIISINLVFVIFGWTFLLRLFRKIEFCAKKWHYNFPSVHIWIWFCIFLAQLEKQRCIFSGGLWSGFLGRPTAAVPFSKSWNSIYNPLKKYSIEQIFLSCFSDSAGVYWFFCDSRVRFFWLWFWCFLVWEAGNLACFECSAIVGGMLII